jgi:hypothetical protein
VSADARRSPLFEAISQRQSTRAECDGRPRSGDDLRALKRAAAGNGVQLILLADKPVLEKALEFVVQDNSAQMNN